MIDLEAVQSLRTVAREGSVVAAAAARGFTPSAVSQQIKRLERETGVTLLERVGRGVALTDAGAQLVVGSTPILEELERLRADLHAHPADDAAISGHVRLAAFSTVVRGLLASVLVDLAAAHPQLNVLTRESEPWETVALVASGQRDLGIAHQWGGVALAIPDHLVVTPLFTDVADVVMHRDHPLAQRPSLRPEDLAEQPWVATFDTTICRQWLRRLFDGVRNAPRVVHESMEFENHLTLARTGSVVALVPRLGRGPLGPDLVAVPTERPASTRDVVAVHRRSQTDAPALRAVLAALIDAGAAIES